MVGRPQGSIPEPEYFEDVPEEEQYDEEPPVEIPMGITEAEYTVHDGGILAGMPALIVKVFSCNLQCVYCDVISPKRVDRGYNSDTMIPLLVGHADIDLVFTGGEPFLQPDALGFLINVGVDARREFGYNTNIMVETNGTISPEILRRNRYKESRVSDDKLNSIIWSINPKFHSSREEWSKTRFSEFFKFPTVEVRMTVNPFDPDDLFDMRRVYSLIPDNVNLVVQPVVQDLDSHDHESYQNSLNEIYKVIIDERLSKIRIVPQLHKVIWGMTRESI